MTSAPGDLVVLIRDPQDADQRYPNVWRGRRLAVLATHDKVVGALRKAARAGRGAVYFQVSPGSRIIGRAVVGSMRQSGEHWEVELVDWQALDQAPTGRSYGTSWYWVK